MQYAVHFRGNSALVFVFGLAEIYTEFYRMKKFFLLMLLLPCLSYGQVTQYVNFFDYKNINTQTFIPMQGWNTEQKYILSILKHSFELQRIVGQPRDTVFLWNGLIGEKTLYSKDSLVLFILRPADTIKR